MTTHTLTTLLELAETDEGREKIRVMVAELMGWKRAGTREGAFDLGSIQLWSHPDREGRTPNLPPLSLDACAEFEAGLRGNDLERYQDHLERVVFRFTTDDDWSEELGVSARTKAWHASALCRSIAYILTKQETKGEE